MSERNPKVVYCHHTRPDYIAPPRLSEHMVVCGPFMKTVREGDRFKTIATPRRHYDLAAVLKVLPAAQAPEAIVVWADATNLNQPINLAAFDCPKVVLLGDTHHLERPLRNVMSYVAAQPFDLLIAVHLRQHAHFFSECGLGPVYWLPGVETNRYPVAEAGSRRREVLFVGQAGKYHPRRRRLLKAMAARRYPVRALRCAAHQAARLYAGAQITFNCSLNGDLNMRVFEVLAAGGFLLTDRLSPQSGIDRVFHDGEHLVLYESADDLVAKLDHYLAHPDEAAAIAWAGHEAFERLCPPEAMAAKLCELVFDGTVDPRFDLAHEPRTALSTTASCEQVEARVAPYEYFQALHQKAESLSVLMLPGADPRLACDIADLPRLKLHIVDADSPDREARELCARAGVEGQIVRLGATEARGRAWDVLVTPADADGVIPAWVAGGLEWKGFVRDKPGPGVFKRSAAGHEKMSTTAYGPERIEELKARYGLDYHVLHALTAQRKVGLKGKRVLEAGGSLPAGFVFDELGAKQWIGIEEPIWWPEASVHSTVMEEKRARTDDVRRLSDVTDAVELGDYEILAGAVETLPSALFGQFDVVFSIAAFQHFLRLPAALDRMFQALRPGGRLFTMLSPIWSGHNGHHLLKIVDKSGVTMDFHSSPIPPWGHLLMRPPELYRHLLRSTDVETAQGIVYLVYHSSHINRLFTEDYVLFFNDSSFEVEEFTGTSAVKMDAEVQKRLEELYPGRRHFANNGIQAVLRRPE